MPARLKRTMIDRMPAPHRIAEQHGKRHAGWIMVRAPCGAPTPCARQIEVAQMSNELVAIPKLLDLLAIEARS
jgi:hypothetical protein